MEHFVKDTIKDIKDYVKYITETNTQFVKNNELLILACFAKAIEIIERNKVKHNTFNFKSNAHIFCQDCNQSFYDFGEYSIHVCNEDAESTALKYECKVCGEKFESREELFYHYDQKHNKGL